LCFSGWKSGGIDREFRRPAGADLIFGAVSGGGAVLATG
jgi:hypothetical protein